MSKVSVGDIIVEVEPLLSYYKWQVSKMASDMKTCTKQKYFREFLTAEDKCAYLSTPDRRLQRPNRC